MSAESPAAAGGELFRPAGRLSWPAANRGQPVDSLDRLHRLLGGKLILGRSHRADGPRLRLDRVVIDSRKVTEGDVFWGLPGRRHHGSEFARHAFQRGAAGAVLDREVPVPEGCWALCVSDTLRALETAARARRDAFSGTLVAVTGSVGKTTTRQMIHTVLSTRLRGKASPHNYNNHLGVPLSLLAIDAADEYAVLELGASGPGEIAALAQLCRPQIGVITETAEAHLSGFGDRMGVARAKAELLAALRRDGWAVLADDPFLRPLASRSPARALWVGRGTNCQLTATDVRAGHGRLDFRVEGVPFSVPVWGRHHLVAALLAVGVGRLFGLALPEMAAALENFRPMPMRCEVTTAGGVTVINDAYNANPKSMEAALELLRDVRSAGRKIAVCGDMAELGPDAPRWHYRLGTQVVTVCGADLLMACGQHAPEVVRGAQVAGMPRSQALAFPSAKAVLPSLRSAVAPGDVVLVKGSRAMRMETVVEALLYRGHLSTCGTQRKAIREPEKTKRSWV